MKELFEQLIPGRAPDSISLLVVGAGQRGLSWRALGAGRLQLVEADPCTAASLEQQLDSLQGESLRCVAATAAALPKSPLHVVNQSRYSSVREPSRLFELFPGLRVTAQLEVDAVSLSQIVADFDSEDAGSCVLVLDTPGQVLELVESLADEQLGRLAGILVEVSAEPLYVGDASAVVIASLLGSRGFSVRGSMIGIYPFQSVFFEREERYWSERLQLDERRGLERDLAVAVERLDDARSTLLVREGELAALSESLASAIADRSHQAQELVALQEQLQQLDERLAHRADQHEVTAASERQLKQAHAELGGQIQRFEDEIKALNSHNAGLRLEADNLRTQLDEREALARQLGEEEIKELHGRIAGMRQEADDLRAQFDEREALARELVEKEIKGLHSRHADVSREADDLRAQLEERETLARQLVEEEIRELRSLNAGLLQEANDLRTQFDEREKLVRQLAEEEIKGLHEHHANVRQEADDLRVQFDEREKLARQLAEEEIKELHRHHADARQEADDLRTQFDERETLLRQLVERRDNLIKAGEDMTVKLEAETKRADGLSKKLEESVSKLEHASRQSQERGARVIDLEREREQAQQYQSWLNREVVKAEAHVDLIKEILLRGETP